MNTIINDDILEFAARYDGPGFHAVLCDPPYELGFMGKSWDSRGVSFRAETWSAIRSLLVPGAHLLAFGGTRTFHRIAVAIEDAGFEIRDTLGWLYGSGFPKSHDVSKAIDREAGVEREVVKIWSQTYSGGTGESAGYRPRNYIGNETSKIPVTDAARAWQGYGTALKPAWEPVIVARNPLAGTVAQNVMEHGAGALNVDGGRIGDDEITTCGGDKFPNLCGTYKTAQESKHIGRWPANIIHDGSDEIAEVMGDAQRFFYCAKAGMKERNEGLDGFPLKLPVGGADKWTEQDRRKGEGVTASARANHHPTVKPLALTEYLARLVIPASVVSDRRILVPFAGSGSECIGAMLAGWETIVGVEREAEYAKIARARLQYHTSDRV